MTSLIDTHCHLDLLGLPTDQVLKEAKDLDADNRQIERNLRIISALQETEYEFHGDGQKLKEPPVPISKPEKTDKEEIEPAKTEAETTQETTES